MNLESDILSLLDAGVHQSIALVTPEPEFCVTYGSLRQQVIQMAGELRALGVRPGVRVATVFQNGVSGLVSFLAAAISGIAAPLNPGYKYDEFRFYLEDLSASLLLCSPGNMPEARRAAESLGITAREVETNGQGVVRLLGAPKALEVSMPQPCDIALMLHTSGTTARPKRVPLTHQNLAASCRNIITTYRLTPDDATICLMPLFHVHGLIGCVLATFLSGGTVVVPSKLNSELWNLIARRRVSWYSAAPTAHRFLTNIFDSVNHPAMKNLRFVRSCSAALSPELMGTIESRLQVPVLEAYGMTEASHQMASNPLPPAQRKSGTVGMATGISISIIDECGKHLAAQQQGEVVIKGPTVISGYENSEANPDAFFQGWFRTGDQGFFDENGYLILTGRLKELINRGGEKIGPQEIDRVLLTHSAIAEAVTFAVPHPSLGEEVAAAVVLHKPEDETGLLSYCRERLAYFKCPKKIYIVDSIPRTSTGKIQRRLLTAAFANGSLTNRSVAGSGVPPPAQG